MIIPNNILVIVTVALFIFGIARLGYEIFTYAFKAGYQLGTTQMETKDTQQLLAICNSLKKELPEGQALGIDLLLEKLTGSTIPPTKEKEAKKDKTITGFSSR